ncbi:MAG TPA: hypothetical protein VND65_02415 [Candidatus Binatia bacterium]|nr:hypothetical protein [Candidatus Binatia bacterium]
MAHTYSSNRIHVIFSTEGREKCIAESLQPKLWAYMAGIAHHQGFEAMIVGGVPSGWDLFLLPTSPSAEALG